jgi:hypothetical protein
MSPRLRAFAAASNSDAKTATMEYSGGDHENMDGALSKGNVLSICGREGLDLATLRTPAKPTDSSAFAFRVDLNDHRRGSCSGDVWLDSTAPSMKASTSTVTTAEHGCRAPPAAQLGEGSGDHARFFRRARSQCVL